MVPLLSLVSDKIIQCDHPSNNVFWLGHFSLFRGKPSRSLWSPVSAKLQTCWIGGSAWTWTSQIGIRHASLFSHFLFVLCGYTVNGSHKQQPNKDKAKITATFRHTQSQGYVHIWLALCVEGHKVPLNHHHHTNYLNVRGSTAPKRHRKTIKGYTRYIYNCLN